MQSSPSRFPRMFAFTCLAILVALPSTGCGRKDTVKRYPVAGRVTLDGQPLSSGTVSFMTESGAVATGKIGADGAFRMVPFGASGDGVPAGRYKVVVCAPDPNALAAMKLPDGPVPSLIPERYNSPDTSGLEFEVKPDSQNQVDFTLKSK